MKLEKGEFSFVALGGLGEVGKNTYVYEVDEKIFILDVGILFPDETDIGIDYIIPDYTYLEKNKERIVGVFITHGHEDHIGGIPFLVKQLHIPKIYAAGIAVELIKNKLDSETKCPIISYDGSSVFIFDDIEVSFVLLNHSIPDMYGIAITSSLGTIFHTGDFKFDYTPVGPKADFQKLTNLKNLLCLFSDSTNANVTGIIKSESVIGKSLVNIFQSIEGRIVIATFASNIYRIKQIIDAAVSLKRKVLILGRSMQTAIDASIGCKYITVKPNVFIEENKLDELDDQNVLILCTGSQGEPTAALSKLADSKHRSTKIKKGDTIIFSSNPIPGNQESINQSIDKLYRLGAKVIINSPLAGTHTSGHGSQNDLKLLLCLTKPKSFIPVHGERRMLTTHRRLAIECGVNPDNILLLDNGDRALVNDKGIRLVDRVTYGDVYIDNKKRVGISKDIIKERRKLADEGFFSIICFIDSFNKIVVRPPKAVSRGLLYMNKNMELTTEIENTCLDIVKSELNSNLVSWNDIKEKLTNYLIDTIYQSTKRKPIILPLLIERNSQNGEVKEL